MSLFRRLPTRRLIAVIAAVLAGAGAVAAIAVAATSSGKAPATKPLSAAVRDALGAPSVSGVTARITFTNSMLGASGIQGSDPMLTGASGRLWARADGHFRLELQSDAGDAQIVSDGKTLSVYSASANTLYKLSLPAERARGAKTERMGGVPSIGAINGALAKLAGQLNLSAASGTTIAGRPAYTVRVTPKDQSGQIGAAEIGWDAATGTPLRIAIYAKDATDPVLELKVTDISFGPVGDDVFITPAPQGARVMDLTPQVAAFVAKARTKAKGAKPRVQWRTVTGARAVQARVPFRLAAPKTLAGLPRGEVRLIAANRKRAAMVTYGRGLGTVAVLQMPVGAKDAGAPIPGGGGRDGGGLPSVSVNGAKAQELPTPLGTILTFTRGGVRYVVAGSVTRQMAEAVARGL